MKNLNGVNKMNNLPKSFTLDGDEYDFKCVDCGEKYTDDMASEHDVALCVWCCPITQEEQEEQEAKEEGGQTDREVQTEHWDSERMIDIFSTLS